MHSEDIWRPRHFYRFSKGPPQWPPPSYHVCGHRRRIYTEAKANYRPCFLGENGHPPHMLLLRLCSRQIDIRRTGSKLRGGRIQYLYIKNSGSTKIPRCGIWSCPQKRNDDCLPCFLYQSFFYVCGPQIVASCELRHKTHWREAKGKVSILQ